MRCGAEVAQLVGEFGEQCVWLQTTTAASLHRLRGESFHWAGPQDAGEGGLGPGFHGAGTVGSDCAAMMIGL